MTDAKAHGYQQAHKLNCGTRIYIYGNRKVIDVHNTHNPNYVRLVTNDGTFYLQRNTWIAPAQEESLT